MPFLSSSVSHQATNFKKWYQVTTKQNTTQHNPTQHNTTQQQQNTRLLHQVQSENNNNTSCNNLPWTWLLFLHHCNKHKDKSQFIEIVSKQIYNCTRVFETSSSKDLQVIYSGQ
jgi:hypothetical protein